MIYSPRRYGKTSLVKRVQARLAEEGSVVALADFFGVTSIEDVALRLAKAVFEFAKPRENIFKTAIKLIKTFRPVLKPDEAGGVSLSIEAASSRRGGADVLDETMDSLGHFILETGSLVNIALDEFQEIVELNNSLKIEGILRSHIQKHQSSYFFVGSRRRILLAMFNERQRPFFQSAINYELGPLPHDELSVFIAEQFRAGGKGCSDAVAEFVSGMVRQHPYYTQKLSFFAYDVAGKEVKEEDVTEAFGTLLSSETPVFEAIIQGLAPQQIALLKAVAAEPAEALFSMEYMKRHGLGSTGGVQGAQKRLGELDLIQKDGKKGWTVVDPVFGEWLKKH